MEIVWHLSHPLSHIAPLPEAKPASILVMSNKLDMINQIERYAIVGGPDWVGGFSGLMGKMLKPEIRAFDLDDQDDAVRWLSEQTATIAAP